MNTLALVLTATLSCPAFQSPDPGCADCPAYPIATNPCCLVAERCAGVAPGATVLSPQPAPPLSQVTVIDLSCSNCSGEPCAFQSVECRVEQSVTYTDTATTTFQGTLDISTDLLKLAALGALRGWLGQLASLEVSAGFEYGHDTESSVSHSYTVECRASPRFCARGRIVSTLGRRQLSAEVKVVGAWEERCAGPLNCTGECAAVCAAGDCAPTPWVVNGPHCDTNPPAGSARLSFKDEEQGASCRFVFDGWCCDPTQPCDILGDDVPPGAQP